MNQKKTEDFDEDGSHNTAFQILQLASTAGNVIFRYESPGESELPRMMSKTMDKDTKEKVAANMNMIDQLINCIHVGQELLAAISATLEEYLEKWIV